MHVCPNCKHEFRQRKDGCCPDCGEALEQHNGRYYRASLGSPNAALVEQLERLVSDRTSRKQHRPIVWRIPRKLPQYRRELAEAERLLEMCEGDADLALETLVTLFSNKQFYRNYTSLIGMTTDFSLAKAITETNLENLAKVDEKEDLFYVQMMQREDVFAR